VLVVKKLFIGIIALGWLFLLPLPTQAAVISQYKILSSETVIDTMNTSAVVDTTKHEIRLPQSGHRISFAGEDYDYVALTNERVLHFTFDGTRMVENAVASVSGLSNPLAVVSPGYYPDVIVASFDDVKHYSFTGGEMVQNPALSMLGLTAVASVSSRGNDIALLQNNQLKHYAFDGSGMSELPTLSIASGLNNPFDIALFPNTFDVAVMEANKVRFFCFTGSGLTEAPDMALSGFANPLKSISVLDGTVSIIEGNQVKTYLYNGSNYSYVQALSVTSSLTAPTCLALRPGSRDMIVADGNEIKYFMFDGSQLVYNPALSKVVTGLSSSGGYRQDAEVQSIAFPRTATATRVTAYCNVPNGTSITWSIYDGGWVPVWRVRGLPESTVLEYTSDGNTWSNIGTANTPIPGSDVSQLWKEHSVEGSVRWKAILHTDNSSATPKIIAPNPGIDTAIMLEANCKPTISVTVPGSCYLTMTPTISWTYTDIDGDTQKAYDFRLSDGSSDLYTYTTASSLPSHTMLPAEDPAIPSQLWNSGLNTFTLKIRAKDSVQWSNWGTATVCFRAFERPRIAEMSVPANGYISPVLGNPSTHKVIKKSMAAADLPVTKAGGQVTMYIDSIGMVDLNPPTVGSLSFPYLSRNATIGEVSLLTTKAGAGQNKRWKMTFWTDPDKTKCPDNTLVKMYLTGSSGGYAPQFNCPDFAEGVVKTKGSVFDNWLVILQGRK